MHEVGASRVSAVTLSLRLAEASATRARADTLGVRPGREPDQRPRWL